MRPTHLAVATALIAVLPATALAQPAPTDQPPAPPLTPPPAAAAPATPPSGAAPEPAPATPAGLQVTSLKIMLQKGIITQAEYDSALKDLTESMGTRAAEDANNLVFSKWSTALYGFAEADVIYDSTESFNDGAGAGLVQRAGTYAGNNGRLQFSPRNSRFGFRVKAPEYHDMRASALMEFDFFSNQAQLGTQQPGYQQTEANFYTNPTLRIRHFYLKVENPIVDVLFGQTWQLFGWQTTYHPNTVQIQGVPGELYARTTQFRLSKTIKSDDFTFDIAIAAARPPQRDSGIPEGEGGVHFAFNKWKATQTMGATGTTVSPLSVAVTGDVRNVNLPQENPLATGTGSSKNAAALAVDAFVPILPGSKEQMGNSLSLMGEFVTGYGIADMYTGLASGVGVNVVPAAGVGPLPPTLVNQAYNPHIDPGIAVYDALGNLHFIQWTTFRGGLQYYLPGLDGKMWVSANYSRVQTANAQRLGALAATLSSLDWFDFNVMGDITPAVRVGVEYANYNTFYGDAVHAIDHRVQGSAFYIF